jgi:rSAM/selenodomain-associated transferase 2
MVGRVRIAVVIPALDEAEQIEAAVRSVWESSGAATGGTPGGMSSPDVVVVDGGSLDRTVDRARAAGARVLHSPSGRALQLEAGWRATEGEVVLFLHADTRLPVGWDAALCGALSDPGVVGGAFGFRFRERRLGLAWIEWGARLRSRAGLPYGDQALFARRSALEAIGGIPQVPIAEDLDFVRALRGRGRLALLPLDALTSARRYLARGPFRTWLRHTLALGAWRLGVDRARIARWVRG